MSSKKTAQPTSRQYHKTAEIEIGIATPTDTGVDDGMDINVSVDDHGGDVTVVPRADGSGYGAWGGPDNWVSRDLLAYILTRPDAQDTLIELSYLAGIEADRAARENERVKRLR